MLTDNGPPWGNRNEDSRYTRFEAWLIQLGIAVPTFLVGIGLIVLFAVNLELLPSGGFPRSGWDTPVDAARALVRPTLTLAVAQGAVLMRFVRASTLDVLHQDYIRTARAKGLTRSQALWRHGLRNAAIPVVSIIGVQLASLIAGAEGPPAVI